ncbi:hypothetical protein M0811_04957 [Anaeramoeba ignava]|uniref:Uncharacterized protein n=1 Tax=Anaeramoeba ignava TaxID=1746090 RepID=A0A9Q0LTB2_ANAIG|nr:hypothetical protein M0811_04957 [Anaeramoeba ignava]
MFITSGSNKNTKQTKIQKYKSHKKKIIAIKRTIPETGNQKQLIFIKRRFELSITFSIKILETWISQKQQETIKESKE